MWNSRLDLRDSWCSRLQGIWKWYFSDTHSSHWLCHKLNLTPPLSCSCSLWFSRGPSIWKMLRSLLLLGWTFMICFSWVLFKHSNYVTCRQALTSPQNPYNTGVFSAREDVTSPKDFSGGLKENVPKRDWHY